MKTNGRPVGPRAILLARFLGRWPWLDERLALWAEEFHSSNGSFCFVVSSVNRIGSQQRLAGIRIAENNCALWSDRLITRERDGYVAVTAPRDEPNGTTRSYFLRSV